MSDYRKHIRRQIRRRVSKASVKSNGQAIILSGLNALQILELEAPKYLDDVLHYGPASFVGNNWAAALIWFRRKGYHEYKELTLLGVWAISKGDESELLIGTKKLHYTAPVFNPESYMQLIKRNFQTHYKDDASPPLQDDSATRIKYETARRLALRQELKDALIQCLRNRS